MEYFKKEDEFIPDKLFAGLVIPVLTGFAEIESGQGLLKRGTLIGKGSNGKYYILGSSVTENSKTVEIVPYGILTDDIDTTKGKINAAVYLSGIFNRSAVYLAEGADISDYEYECRKLSIYFEDTIN